MIQDEPLRDQRVLLRAATTRDAATTREVLTRAGIATHTCTDLKQLIDALEQGAGVLMIAEEAAHEAAFTQLGEVVAAQPPWSDIPIIVLARHGADSAALARMVSEFSNTTVIERPMRLASLVSAVQSGLRARRRQYQMRTLLSDLHESDQRKTQFLATLAHELRNPLAPITNALELLSRQALAPAEIERVHRMMGRQIGHMVRLIDDLMEVSRITRNKIDMRLEPLTLGDVIADAVELSRPQINAAGHRLSIDIPDEPLTLNGDRVRLTQVFSNLLNNATKYTPAGGSLRVVARRSGRYAEVAISDTGVGLAPQTLDAIFEMFVQVGGTARLAQGGLGIGLTLAKSLVTLHGGQVKALSDGIGRGSTFVVTLPLAGQAGAAPPPAPRLAAGSARRRVLVVDDNRDAADSLSMLLQMLGATVTTAYSGEDALRRVDSGDQVDIAVLDIGMPGVDGCDLARELRQRPGGSEMTVIAVTGWGQPELTERLAAAGFDHHLLKPVDLAQLLRLFRTAARAA